MNISRSLKHPLINILAISVVINAVLWILAKWLFQGEESIILHYSTAIGIDFIGNSNQIITLPLVGLIILIGNLLLGALTRAIDLKTAWILWGIIPISQFMLCGAFSLVWLANQ